MLDQLMWKDFRNQAGVLLLGLFFLAGPYGMYVFNPEPNALASSVILSQIASLMTFTVLGATIIGQERQNRGMDFLLGMPISKSRILMSKSLICLLVAAIIWGSALLITEVFVDTEPQQVVRLLLSRTAAIGVSLFGMTWLFSVLFRGFAIPIGAALVVDAILLLLALKYFSSEAADPEAYYQNVSAFFYPACFATGLLSFMAGWGTFMRKMEP